MYSEKPCNLILNATRLIEDHCIMSVYIIIHKIYSLGHLGIDLQ